MIKRHANLRFQHYKQAELAPLANYIVDTMGKNADVFATPTPSLAEVKKLIDAYSAVLGKSDYAGQTGDIHAARHALHVISPRVTSLNTSQKINIAFEYLNVLLYICTY